MGTELTVLPGPRVCLVTSDGCVSIHDVHRGTVVCTDLQVGHQLIPAACVINRKVDPVLTLCGFDGSMYMVDGKLNAIQCVEGERVCAFIAGDFALAPGIIEPCIISVNFDNCVRLYAATLQSQLESLPLMSLQDGFSEFSPDQVRRLLYRNASSYR
jgi:hypothetical protein